MSEHLEDCPVEPIVETLSLFFLDFLDAKRTNML
jgi:hypothetical protein